jgi:hypothetical protein
MTMAATISGSRIGSNGGTQRLPGANEELPGAATPVKVLNSGASGGIAEACPTGSNWL